MNTRWHGSPLASLGIVLFVFGGCGPGDPAPDCVPVDEQLGVPADRQWCDGVFTPKTLEWEGQAAADGFPVCLPPQADGSCELCPTAKVTQDVEEKLFSRLPEFRPLCQLDHWELGCMRTIENAIAIGREPDYCCFQVALWGKGCSELP